jgi:pimeloyl-ACP methyl ester carboxylesterase
MFGDLKKEIQEEQRSHGIIGQVEGATRAKGNVFVLLYAKKDGRLQLERFTLPDNTGIFSFIVTHGTYLLTAFADQNANRRHDPGEPAGAWGKPDEITVHQGSRIDAYQAGLSKFVFGMDAQKFPIPGVDTSVENMVYAAASLIKLGQVVDWDDPIFNDKQGSIGFWKPMTFLRQHGAGIYFITPYDPDKIPILFVHGASGTPSGFKTLADSMDDRRFQPWVFYYPSGLRLKEVSSALNEMIKQLQIDYGFDRMGVVAHSMGGLVSRAFIINHLVEDSLRTVRVFVSISTPWGGVCTAVQGVEHAPEAIPSWHDVVPDSKFIEQIFEDPLYPEVPHYLIFSYRGNCSTFMSNNDGTVELSSQLDTRAQDEATTTWGVDEDHWGILFSNTTAAYVNQAIDSAFPKTRLPK